MACGSRTRRASGPADRLARIYGAYMEEIARYPIVAGLAALAILIPLALVSFMLVRDATRIGRTLARCRRRKPLTARDREMR